MGLFDRFKNNATQVGDDQAAKRKAIASINANRAYAAAQMNDQTALWRAELESINKALESGGKTLRARSRDLEQNNAFARKFLGMVEDNVVGHEGFVFSPKIRNLDGSMDRRANRELEDAWRAWSMDPTIQGGMSLVDVQRMIVRTVARDGAVLVVKHRSPLYLFGFKISVHEVDFLKENFAGTTNNGNTIRHGIELDQMGRVVAYHLHQQNPNDVPYAGVSRTDRTIRVQARDVIHLFQRLRPGQIHGEPWMAPGMIMARTLEAVREASAIAARIASSKMGFVQTQDGLTAGLGDVYDEADNPADFVDQVVANVAQNITPGVIDVLPPGTSIEWFDPKHPTTGLEEFQKAIGRGIASAWGVTYHELFNDLEGVNYSSARVGELPIRERWKKDQNWMISGLMVPLARDWIETALLDPNGLGFPWERTDKFRRGINFRARGWKWVDPQKEAQAAVTELQHVLRAPSDIAADRGERFVDICDQYQEDLELMKERGIPFNQFFAGGSSPTQSPEEEDLNE